MKMRVQRRDGRVETIALVGPAEIHHGEDLDHVHSADGLDHYFTPDGFYDGWGRAAEGMTGGDVAETIDRVEGERTIEEGP